MCVFNCVTRSSLCSMVVAVKCVFHILNKYYYCAGMCVCVCVIELYFFEIVLIDWREWM